LLEKRGNYSLILNILCLLKCLRYLLKQKVYTTCKSNEGKKGILIILKARKTIENSE
jgi:hypothetical protein